MSDKTCNNCKHFWVDASEEPCISCENFISPSNWEAR